MAKAINPHIRIHVDFFIRKLKLGLIYIKVHGIKLIFSFGFSKHVLTREPAGLRPYSPRHTESSVCSHKKAEKETRCCFFQHPVAITISFLRHTFPCASILLLGFEHLFTLSTQRTYPIFGQIFEGRSGSHPVIGIAHLRIINVSAHFAFVLFHLSNRIKITPHGSRSPSPLFPHASDSI